MLLRYLAGPFIGSVIGYFTNYIAVKMLFYPRKEVRVFGHRLPFTPGAIPKGKERLGRAIGEVVSKTLVTKEDIQNKLITGETVDKLADLVAEQLEIPVRQEIISLANCSEERYISKRDKMAGMLSKVIAETLSRMDFSELIVEKGTQIIKDNLNNPMLMMFVTDELLASILYPMGGELQKFLYLEGEELMTPIVLETMEDAEQQPTAELIEKIGFDTEDVKKVIRELCVRLIQNGIGPVMESLDLQGIIETKINEMSVEELEHLVLTVMKKELNTIVNLGALIGFILGLLNIWL